MSITVPDFGARLHAVKGLLQHGFDGVISIPGMFPEEEEPLREAGADLIVHPLSEAGAGLAEDSLRLQTG